MIRLLYMKKRLYWLLIALLVISCQQSEQPVIEETAVSPTIAPTNSIATSLPPPQVEGIEDITAVSPTATPVTETQPTPTPHPHNRSSHIWPRRTHCRQHE